MYIVLKALSVYFDLIEHESSFSTEDGVYPPVPLHNSAMYLIEARVELIKTALLD